MTNKIGLCFFIEKIIAEQVISCLMIDALKEKNVLEQKKQRQKFDIKQKIVKMNYFEMFEMKQIPFSDYMTIYIILLKVRNLIHIPN